MADWIKLNVGGQIFQTTKTTLMSDPESMLARMFSQENLAPAQSEDGAFLIDSPPEYFRPILNYLRRKELILDEHINPTGVLAEAKYYGIKDIIAILEKPEIEEEESRFILAIGGIPTWLPFWNTDGSAKVELLDLQEQKSYVLNDLPRKTVALTGGLMMGEPVIYCSDYPSYQEECFKLTGTRWKKVRGGGGQGKAFRSAIVLPSKMWIHGGSRGLRDLKECFNDSCFITNDGKMTAGPDLPTTLAAHASILVNDEVVIVGGRETLNRCSNRTLIFKASDLSFVKQGPRLNHERQCVSITKFSSLNHEGREVIMVAGGFWIEAGLSLEIWDYTQPNSTWEEIGNLPKAMIFQNAICKPALLPFENGVIIMHGNLNYKLVLENNGYRFEKFPLSLKCPRVAFLPIAIPSSLAYTLIGDQLQIGKDGQSSMSLYDTIMTWARSYGFFRAAIDN